MSRRQLFPNFDNENIKCLFLFFETKIVGFCILFHGEQNNYYDKIFYSNYYLKNHIKKYLKSLVYLCAYDNLKPLIINDYIKLEHWNFKAYPYIDSFNILEVKSGFFRHNSYNIDTPSYKENVTINSNDTFRILKSTSGTCDCLQQL